VAEVLEQVGLDAVGRRPVKASLGMRQRLGLAAALLRNGCSCSTNPNGLDPQGVRGRDLLVSLNEQGDGLPVQPLLTEVEALCTRIGVLDRGRLVLQG
jgi:ABC-2 type transport system ATP-binding protein